MNILYAIAQQAKHTWIGTATKARLDARKHCLAVRRASIAESILQGRLMERGICRVSRAEYLSSCARTRRLSKLTEAG